MSWAQKAVRLGKATKESKRKAKYASVLHVSKFMYSEQSLVIKKEIQQIFAAAKENLNTADRRNHLIIRKTALLRKLLHANYYFQIWILFGM